MRAAVMPSLDARDMKSLAAQANKTICGARLGCSNCTDDDSCVWCESDNLCKNGTWYGPDGEIIKGCSDWRWKQCKVNGKAVFWSAVGIAALIVLLVLVGGACCCYCCCCRRKTYQRYYDVEDLRAKEREERRREGEARRNAMYDKYGTPEERARMQLDEYNRKSYYSPVTGQNKRSSIFTSN